MRQDKGESLPRQSLDARLDSEEHVAAAQTGGEALDARVPHLCVYGPLEVNNIYIFSECFLLKSIF